MSKELHDDLMRGNPREERAPVPDRCRRTRGSLRVVLVVRSLGLGGAERQATLLANGLHCRFGWMVSVVGFEPGSRVPALLHPEVNVYRWDPGSAGSPVRRAVSLAGLVARLRGLRPDALIPFTDHPNRVIGAVWPLTGAGGAVWNQRDEGRQVTNRPLERLALALTSTFVANSEVGRQFLCRRLGVASHRIRLIRNGVALTEPADPPSRWRAKLRAPRSAVVVTMVANLSHHKDHATLLRAWPSVLSEAGRPVLLALAGRFDDSTASIRSLVGELGVGSSVRLLGEVTDVAGLLAASDVAVLSSEREGCPNTVLEAMAAGLPVVATDIVGTREALGDGSSQLVPPQDPDAFAAAIVRLLGDPEARRRIGEDNRVRAATVFSPDTAAERWATVALELAGVRPRHETTSR